MTDWSRDVLVVGHRTASHARTPLGWAATTNQAPGGTNTGEQCYYQYLSLSLSQLIHSGILHPDILRF